MREELGVLVTEAACVVNVVTEAPGSWDPRDGTNVSDIKAFISV